MRIMSIIRIEFKIKVVYFSQFGLPVCHSKAVAASVLAQWLPDAATTTGSQ